jgi:RNA polymerase sigma-70 factor (ECF subfamily)
LIRLDASSRSTHNARSITATARDDARRPVGEANGLDERTNELDWVRSLVAGDPAAWRAFVEQFQRLVLARVAATARELRLELRSDDAEDVAAEVFSQLVARDFAALREFQGRSSLSTWLSVITRRISLRRLLGARREPANPQYAGAPVELSGDHQEDPLAQLIRHENRQRLEAALAELPERHRDLVRLHYLDGCSYREISERLGIPANSIGPSLQRVQQKLREKMQS